MAINHKDSYSTMRMLGLQKTMMATANAINSLRIVGNSTDIKIRANGDNASIIEVIKDAETVRAFYHPINIDRVSYIDTRPYRHKTGDIRSALDVSFLYTRCGIDQLWAYKKEAILPYEKFIIDAFSTWVANNIARRTNSSLEMATAFRIVAAVYYLNKFVDIHFKTDDERRDYLLQKLPSLLRLPNSLIEDILMAHENIFIPLFTTDYVQETDVVSKNGITLAKALASVSENTIKLDYGVLVQALCGGAYIGANATDVAEIAIEYPPAFIAILSVVSNRNTQQQTGIGKAVISVKRNYDLVAFEKFINLNTVGI